jgi:poly(beta-D-mannuronate) lyase
MLAIENVVLTGTNTQYAFSNLKENMSSLYNLTVTDCEISNFDFVLKAYKETFADAITFTGTSLKNCANGIELAAEINDKGDYNTEFLTVDNCQFDNIPNNVIDYYRGGYDESTIGGNLILTNSTFTNCGAKEANGILLNTRGIINVNINNNVFKNNRVKLVALLWGAKNNTHSDNEFVNSSKIIVEENLKLKLVY